MHRLPHACPSEAAFMRLRGIVTEAVSQGAPVGLVLMTSPDQCGDDIDPTDVPYFTMLMSPDRMALQYVMMSFQAHEEMIRRFEKLYVAPDTHGQPEGGWRE